jgi:hypothetical protein
MGTSQQQIQAHQNVQVARQHMSANRIPATLQSCTVIGVVTATGAPFSRGFASYQIAEQWLANDASAAGLEITRVF